MKAKPSVIILLLALSGGLLLPESAFAIQTHGAPEGLYIHQIGHVLFASAMLGFAWRIGQSRLRRDTAWRLMSCGAVLLALWNGWAFSGHFFRSNTLWAGHAVPSDHGMALVVYYSQMDHLLCVPALLCIYFALRKMTAASRKFSPQEQERT